MARELKVVLTGDNRDLARMFKSADKDASSFERRMGSMSTRTVSALGSVAKGAGLLGAAIGGGLVLEAKRAFSAFEESNKIARQTGAVLKSTGGAANVTANEVAALASALSKKTGVDDEAIQSGENLLLTFTNVRNEAGKGNDIFSQGTKVLTDMSVALGQDTKSSAIQLGKALNDPIKGVTALQRVGVSFTADQKEQITTLVESGKTLDAQKLILRELTKEFGGSAAAQATSTDKMKVAVGNLEEALGRGLAPAVNSVADEITSMAKKAEPVLLRIGDRIGNIFGRKDLDLAGKIKLSEGVLRRNLRPLSTEIKAALKDADLGDKLATAVEKAAPKIADAAAKAAPRAAGAFVNAFQNAGPWGKLITVAFLANKLGAFNAAGSLAANRLLGGLRSNTTKGAVSKAIGPGTSAAATAQGAVSGRAYSTSFAASSATAMPGQLGKQKGKFTRASRALGGVMGLATAAAFGLAFKPEIEGVLNDFISEAKGRLKDFGDLGGDVLDGLLGNTDKNPTGFGRPRSGAGDQTPLHPNPIAPLPRRDRESNRGTGGRPRRRQSGGRASAATARVSARSSALASASSGSGIVALGRQLQREGYLVGEHPAFGGVHPVHTTNSYHYRGLAIDVNGGPGGEPGSLDALYARLQGKPGVVELLWRVKGHYDHLHVAVVGSTNPLGGSSGGSRSGSGAGGGSAPAAPREPAPPKFRPMSTAQKIRENRARNRDALTFEGRQAERRAAGRRARRRRGRGGFPTSGPAKGVDRGEGLQPGESGLDAFTEDVVEVDTSAEDARLAALEENTRALQEQAAALQGVKDEMKRQSDIATSALATDKFQAMKYIADMLSGQFGRGIVGRSMTAGTATEVLY